MKKFLLSIVAAFAALAMFAQNPVDRFLELYNQATTVTHLMDNATSAEKEGLSSVMNTITGDFLTHYDNYKSYLLKPADRAKLENYFDIFQNFNTSSLNNTLFQELKNTIYNSPKLGDIYKCLFPTLISNWENGGVSMQTYSFMDLTFRFPKTYKIQESDTEHGVHVYIQDDETGKLSNSIFMDIDLMDVDELRNASTRTKMDYLMEACQQYFVRYINDSYTVTTKSDFTQYPDDDFVMLTLSGTAYSYPFNGTFISLFFDRYCVTAFITGCNDAEEDQVFDYFLSFMN